jgi:tetratricopeptide (TPR) repeat protein
LGRLSLVASLTAVVAGAVLAAPLSAQADEPTAQGNEQRALALFDKSKASYRAGRFQEAVALLKEAYALKHVPVLLYNLGRAYEGLGDLDNALRAYSDFLVAQPDTPDRGAIEGRTASLKHQIDERERLKREREAADARAAQAPLPEKHRSVVPWIVAGVGAAGVGAGVVFGLIAESKHATASNDPVQVTAAEEQSNAKSFATAANLTMIAGGVVLVGGVVWGALGLGGPARPPDPAAASRIVPVVSVGPGFGVLAVRLPWLL